MRLVALLHDAAEAYLVDLPRPVKRASALGSEYMKIEERVHAAVFECFGLNPILPQEIKDADNVVLMTEARDLMAKPPMTWKESKYHPLDERIIPWAPIKAKVEFLRLFHEYGGRE